MYNRERRRPSGRNKVRNAISFQTQSLPQALSDSQCDLIWHFLMFWTIPFGIFWKISLLSKTHCGYFEATFGKILATLVFVFLVTLVSTSPVYEYYITCLAVNFHPVWSNLEKFCHFEEILKSWKPFQSNKTGILFILGEISKKHIWSYWIFRIPKSR